MNYNQDQLKDWLAFRDTFLDELLRHDRLGDFLGQKECSNCGIAARVIKCKDCSSGRMLKCPDCVVELHRALPLHCVEVHRVHLESPDGSLSPDCSMFNRDGMGSFLMMTPSKTLDTGISLAIPEDAVLALSLVLRILLYSTSLALIPSPSITANAANNLCQTGLSCYESNGFRLHSYTLKPCSHSTASKHFTNSRYKGRLACMIIITPFYNDLIMLTFRIQS